VTAVKRGAAIAATCLLGAAVSACGQYAEVTSQTQIWRDQGASGTAGDVEIRDAVLVADSAGERTTLYTAFANTADADEVVRIRVGEVWTEPVGGPLVIPTLGYAALTPRPTALSSYAARLDVAGADTVPGYFVEVEYVFAEAPRIMLNVPVRPDDGYYTGSLD
jgi:hypothetical protein